MRRNIQQIRADFALSKVSTLVSDNTPQVQRRFKAYSNGLPAMVQTNGIGQALAFAFQKSNGNGDEARAWKLLFNLISEWLLQRGIWGNTKGSLLERLSRGNQEQYQLAQAELQALLAWVKDFSRALIKGEIEQGD
ncbi:hypothetical protein AAEX37_02017 [Oligella sp. MSHR50489EDL]|uniref:type III-B CRISPR module-associated protein Cmr5 n=1 Tax=Oligella sp. MSHR50489EDL TaxID=3139409 RepID=UPI003D81920F